MNAPRPFQEQRRLQVLRQHHILDTAPEEVFDEIVEAASNECGMPMAAFTLLDAERLWLKAFVGLDVQEIKRSTALCSHVVANGSILVVEDLSLDERFRKNPLVVKEQGFGFYAGFPIRAKTREVLGTLCVFDYVARQLPWSSYRQLKRLAARLEALLANRQTMSTH